MSMGEVFSGDFCLKQHGIMQNPVINGWLESSRLTAALVLLTSYRIMGRDRPFI